MLKKTDSENSFTAAANVLAQLEQHLYCCAAQQEVLTPVLNDTHGHLVVHLAVAQC
jgi:hypothetical protein